MKKSISIILALIMTLSCMTTLALPTFATGTAPVGTGIDSLDDITDLTADYYLTSAIGTPDAPNATTISDAFTGTLDGNGKTIYTSVPVFDTLGEGAEVKSLTIKGDITAANENTGALVKDVTGSITLTGVTNDADITFGNDTVSTKVAVGGIVGAIGNMAAGITTTADTDLCTLTMTGCVNNGSISVSSTKCIAFVGGLVGGTRCRVIATECVNNGALSDVESATFQIRIGGIIGQTVYVNSGNEGSIEDSVFTSCVNNGTITYYNANAGSQAGGMIAFCDTQNNHVFDGCVNSETAVIDATRQGTKNPKVGGMVGVQDNVYLTFELINCRNKADIKATYIAGGMIGDSRGVLTMKGCVNDGDLYSPADYNVDAYFGGMIGQTINSDLTSKNCYIENCVNNGDFFISTPKTTNLVAGMVGQITIKVNYTFLNCTNNGDITVVADGGGSKTAGIVGVLNSGTAVSATFVGCVNSGNVEAYAMAAGIVADIRTPHKLVGCVNRGDVTAKPSTTTKGEAAGFVGRATAVAVSTTLWQCINYGNIINSVGTEDGVTYQNASGKMSAMLANVHANGTVSMSFCENMGTVTGDATLVGFLGTTENCIDRATLDDTTAAVEFEGIQRSVAVENETTFDVRFITSVTDIDQYSTTGILVYVAESGSSDVKFKDANTDTVYTQISGSEDGVNVVYPETAVEGKYFTALTVTDISVEGTYTFIVVPYTIALDGETVAYGEAYTTVITDGVITACYNLANGAN